MRNDALKVFLVPVILGVFGYFIRWLQLANAFESETGLAVTGAPISTVMALYIILMLGGIAGETVLLLRTCAMTPDRTALTVSGRIWPLLLRAAGALLALAGLIVFFTAGSARYVMMQRLLGVCAAASGAVLFFRYLPAEEAENGSADAAVPEEVPAEDGRKPRTGTDWVRVCSLVPTVFCCVWLICAYRAQAENPTLWAYLTEMLAIMAFTLAFYEVSACLYGRGHTGLLVALPQCAVALGITTLADSRSAGQTLILLALLLTAAVISAVTVNRLVERK